MDQRHQLQLTPRLLAGARLRHTIQATAILRMNAEDLYAYLSQAAEANPMLTVSRAEGAYLPLRSDAEDREAGSEPWDFAPRQERRSLRAHLLSQLPLAELEPRRERIVRYIIDGLDEGGYFTESPAHLARRFRVDKAAAQGCLELVRSLEPAGVAAAGPRECLLFQLRALPEGTELAQALLTEHWELLAAQPRPKALAARLGRTPEEVRSALALISRLNPRPSNGFTGQELTAYITPDAYLLREGEELRVLPAACCTLQLDPYYQALLAETGDLEARRYLTQCARQAENLLQGLRQREELLLRIFTEIVRTQRAFLQGGAKTPLQQQDVARSLGLNASTVSRAVRNKYLYYWGGLLPAASLFSRPLPGGGASVHAAMRELERLIGEEDKSAPWSDRILCQRLEERGIAVSRRVLAKYREQMGLPPAYLRREAPGGEREKGPSSRQ